MTLKLRETRDTRIKDLSADTRRIVAAGLQIFVRNAKAASGTVKGLRHDEMSKELIDEVEHITADIAPLFDDQTDVFSDKPGEEQEQFATQDS
jgi:hypothetical protein